VTEGFNPAILFGWALAALLFGLSLWLAAGGQLRRGAHIGFAGVAVLGAVTLYSHDVMAMPQMCAALLAGGALGLLIGRGVPKAALPAWLGVFAGQAGLAALLVALAAWRNPHAFRLLDDATDGMVQGAVAAMGLGAGFGAMACGGAMTILRREGTWIGPLLFGCGLAMLAGGMVRAFAHDPQLGVMGGGIGVGLIAGHGLVKGALRAGVGPALAAAGGMAGWAVAACGFLLENMGLAVAGGLAGATASLFALRLCGWVGRKGLADAGRHA